MPPLERTKAMARDKYCQFCRNPVHVYATVCPHCTRKIDTIEAINQRETEYSRRRGLIIFLGAMLILVWIVSLFKHFWSQA